MSLCCSPIFRSEMSCVKTSLLRMSPKWPKSVFARASFFFLLLRSTDALGLYNNGDYARAYWIPCVGFHRDCYPTFESCYDRRYCMLNAWILLSLALFAALCFLGVLLVFYFVLFRRGKWMICGIVSLSIAAFLLTLAVFITVALHHSQEQRTPEHDTKAQRSAPQHDGDNGDY